jgi:hypothetical protein
MATTKNTNFELKWSLRSLEIACDTRFETPEITAILDIHGTPGFTFSHMYIREDLQNRLNGMSLPEIKNVIFNDPATIVFWADDTKTVVKCQEGDTFNPETGLAMAIVKKMYGNTGKYCEIFKKWVPEVECEYPNIMINLDCSGEPFVRALEKIGEAVNRTTMARRKAPEVKKGE